jgi:hypothetical protein
MRRNVLLLITAASFLGVTGAASAQAPPSVFPHQHFIIKASDGTNLPVGPDVCANPEAAQGFYGFHQNIHFGTPNSSAFQNPNNPVGFTAVAGCP